MTNGVLSRLRSRFLALNAEGLTVTAERFPAENELVGAETCFERGTQSLEIKNSERENPEGLYRRLAWMRALCEVDQKFLASLDPQLVTDVLFDTSHDSFL